MAATTDQPPGEPGTTKPYSFDDHPEHAARLEEWRDKWIANALCSEAMSAEEIQTTRDAIDGLYRAADLQPPDPHRVLFVSSPLVGAVAASVAAGAWWIREHGEEAARAFGAQIGERQIMASVVMAAAICVTRCLAFLRDDDGSPADASAVVVRTTNYVDPVVLATTNSANPELAIRATIDSDTRDAVFLGTAAVSWVEQPTREAIQSALSSAMNSAGSVRDTMAKAVDDATELITSPVTINTARAVALAAEHSATVDATSAPFRDAINAGLNNAVELAMRQAVHEAVNNAVNDAVNVPFRDAINAGLNNAVGFAMRRAVPEAVTGAVNSAVEVATRDATSAITRDSTSDVVRDATGDATSYSIHDAMDAAVNSVAESAARSATDSATYMATTFAVDDATHNAAMRDTGGFVDSDTQAAADATYDAIEAAMDDGAQSATHRASAMGLLRINGREKQVAATSAALVQAMTDEVNRTRQSTNNAMLDAIEAATNDVVSGATRSATDEATYMATDTDDIASLARQAVEDATFRDASRATVATADALTAAVNAAVSNATRDVALHGTIVATRTAVSDPMRVPMRAAVTDAGNAAVSDPMSAAVSAAVNVASRDIEKSADATVRAMAIMTGTDANIASAVTAQARAFAINSTSMVVDEDTSAVVAHATGDAMEAVVATPPVIDRVTAFLVGCATNWWRLWNGGNMWSGWPSYLSFFRHVAQLPIDYSKWQHYETLALHSGPRFMHQRFCIVSDRPEFVHRDDAHRAHCIDGPHIRWRDGVELHHIHGIRVPPHVTAGRFTARQALEHPNAEVRRVMVERYNQGDNGRWIRDVGAEVVHSDVDWMGRPRRLLRIEQPGDEPYVAVEVTNSTPEEDGTYRVYVERCTPDLRPHPDRGACHEDPQPQEMTCQNAIASRYGFYGHEYRPVLET